jgi:myosin heavy subunit
LIFSKYSNTLGTSPTEKQAYLLEDIGNYSFLKNGDVAMPNVDDAHEFTATLNSMKVMGFVDEEITCEYFQEFNRNYTIVSSNLARR